MILVTAAKPLPVTEDDEQDDADDDDDEGGDGDGSDDGGQVTVIEERGLQRAWDSRGQGGSFRLRVVCCRNFDIESCCLDHWVSCFVHENVKNR